MANSKIGIIITREFNERVRKKSFIVTTILMPVLMIGLMVAPALIMRYSQGETRHISVVRMFYHSAINSMCKQPRIAKDSVRSVAQIK